MEDYVNKSCENCPYRADTDQIRRNRQYDIIYCDKCEETFERRMKPWHCPFSPLVKQKEKVENNG